ncbi:MAG: hypothetical protein EBR30_25975 [Cytophagia bacterium]|nr:hypothetical protein [Cytophagia bacterium]
MISMRIVFAALLVFSMVSAYAQEKEDAKWDLGLEGMAAFAVGEDFYAFNVGGPSLLLRLNKDLKIGFGALPSFYVKEGRSGAKLGVSPRIDYKNFVVIAPFFHFETSGKWIGTVGFGYKFHKVK